MIGNKGVEAGLRALEKGFHASESCVLKPLIYNLKGTLILGCQISSAGGGRLGEQIVGNPEIGIGEDASERL